MLIFLIILFLAFNFSLKSACDDWEKGLNNTKIDNNPNKFSCEIIKPKKCYLRNKLFIEDKTKKLNVKCTDRKIEEQTILKSYSTSKTISNKTKRIGYPITANNPIFTDFKFYENLKIRQTFYSNLIDMDNQNQLKSLGEKFQPEVYVDFTKDPYGELKIQVNFNKNLSESRKKLAEKSESLYNNILLIYIDAVSRNQFLEKFPKTSKLVEKFMSYKGVGYNNKKSQTYHSFEFFKYQSLKLNSLNNLHALHYGRTAKEIGGTHINGDFQNQGFITAQVSDECEKEVTYIWMPESVRNSIKFIEYDHEFITSGCDPEYWPIKKKNIALYTETIRCIYGKRNLDYMFEYAKKFWDIYPDNKKYLTIHNGWGHEITGRVVTYVDEPLYDFLTYFFDHKYLENTLLLLYSDHGWQLNFKFTSVNADDFMLEHNLPALYLIISDKKNMTYSEQYQNISTNQQTLITSFDIHYTLMHAIYGNNYNKYINHRKIGTSLFEKIDQKARNCDPIKEYTGNDKFYFCTCKKFQVSKKKN